MDDVAVVSILQSVADLDHDVQFVDQAESPALGDQLGNRFPVKVLHDQVWISVLLSAVEDGHDVFVVEAAGRLHFPGEEAVKESGRPGHLILLQHFDRYRTTDGRVVGAEDYPHPARPDDVDHGVLADLSNGGLNAHVERPPGSQ